MQVTNKEKQVDSVLTYEELAHDFSHFEVAFLAFHKAIDLIREGVYLNQYVTKDHFKPKVGVVALKLLCENLESAKQYKDQLMEAMFTEQTEESMKDDYNVDDGHLPGHGLEG